MTVQNNRVSIKLCQSYFCPSGCEVRKRRHERSVCHGPLRSTTCSTRATCSPPPPFLPSLARTPACLPTDRRHSHLPSSSHRSPDVLHSLDSLSLPLSLAPAWACPPTDRPLEQLVSRIRHQNEVRRNYLQQFLLSCFSPGYFRFCSGESLSLTPTRTCPPTDRLDDATTAFPPLCLTDPPLPPSVRWFPTLPRNWSLAPKRSPPHLTVAFAEPFHARMFFRFLLWRIALARPYVGVSADRPSYDATTASLLTSSEASFSFPTFFTRLTHASTVPTLAHPLEWACPLSVRLQSLFCRFTSLVRHLYLSACFFFVRCRPSSSSPNLKPTFLSHWATYGATATDTSASFTDHPSPAFCPYILSRSRARLHRWRWFPTLSRDWSQGYVTK